MDEALAVCGDREVRLDAQTGLTAFYAGYGFEVTGPEFDEDGVMHVPMRRVRATTRAPGRGSPRAPAVTAATARRPPSARSTSRRPVHRVPAEAKCPPSASASAR